MFRRPVSEWTFGSPQFAGPVAMLALAVWLRSISDGQAALIQGMRRIGDLARISVFSAFFGAVISVALMYVLRERGRRAVAHRRGRPHGGHLLVVSAQDRASGGCQSTSPQAREEAGAC